MKADNLDFSLLPDVMLEFSEHLTGLEHNLHDLVENPSSKELIASTFRHLHSIKGDFAYCHATPIMEFTHGIEGVVQVLREQKFLCSALVAEALLQSLDQVRLMSSTLEVLRPQDDLPEPPRGLSRLIDKLAASTTQAQADEAARRILLSVHGVDVEEDTQPILLEASVFERALELGKQLSDMLALRGGPHWKNRGQFQENVVLAMRRHYPQVISEQALILAVWWHDVGMLSVCDAQLHAQPKIAAEGWDAFAAHPELSAQALLAIAPECTDAAQIIRQHHQWANGKGVRASQYSGTAHAGALMLACADVLFDRTAGLNGEAYRRGVLRALFDVNGGLESRFDAWTINAFEAAVSNIPPQPSVLN